VHSATPFALDTSEVGVVLNTQGEQGEHFSLDSPKFYAHYMWDQEAQGLAGFVYFTERCEGPHGGVHGGCLATVLDETLAFSTLKEGPCVTGNLSIKYHRFVMLGCLMRVEARVERRDGKKIYVAGRIYDPLTGTTHTSATGTWISYDWLKPVNDTVGGKVGSKL
jgi:acyl-coenzyme A thioesterase PaaI-like protein